VSLSPTIARPALLGLLGLGALCAGACSSTPEVRGVASISSQGRVSAPVTLALARALEVETGGALPDGVPSRRLERLRQAFQRAAGAQGGALHVLATHEPRLQALPGGRVVISRGLIAGLATADARQPLVAGALAHEVAYASLGYPQADLMAGVRLAGHERLGASIAPLVSAGQAAPADAASLAAARDLVLRPRTASGSSLERRVAADRLATRLLARLGYPAQTLERTWEQVALLEGRDPEAFRSFSALHGSGAERQRSARVAAKDLGRLPARRDVPFSLELKLLVQADGERALLEALAPLARAGRSDELQRLLSGEAALRAQATWLGLRARSVVIESLAGEDQAKEREARGAALEADLRRLLLRAPLHSQARLLLAQRYLRAERLEAARQEARILVARSPLWAEAQLLLARATPDPGAARQRAALARDLDTRAGRVAEAARRFLEGESEDSVAAPDPNRDRGKRSFLGGGR
jgi:predicted Zn-dependent protease